MNIELIEATLEDVEFFKNKAVKNIDGVRRAYTELEVFKEETKNKLTNIIEQLEMLTKEIKNELTENLETGGQKNV